MDIHQIYEGMKFKVWSEIEPLPRSSADDKYMILATLFQQVGYGAVATCKNGLSTFRGRKSSQEERMLTLLEIEFYLYALADRLAHAYDQSDTARQALRYAVFEQRTIPAFVEEYSGIQTILDMRTAAYGVSVTKNTTFNNPSSILLNHLHFVTRNKAINPTDMLIVVDAFTQAEDYKVIMELELMLFQILIDCLRKLFTHSKDFTLLSTEEIFSLVKTGIQDSSLDDFAKQFAED